MFVIEITDAATGKVVADIEADRYAIATQYKNTFTKSFSHSDFVDQLGLIKFMEAEVLREYNTKMSQVGGG